MKILFYNMGYATGIQGDFFSYALKGWRYLYSCHLTLDRIGRLLSSQQADVVCLQECDSGSIRNQLKSQISYLAKSSHYDYFKSYLKYDTSGLKRLLPILKHQHNAVLSRKKGESIAHYLNEGSKKLIIEHRVNNISIFNVHLSLLSKKSRKKQLNEISLLLKKCKTPYLIGGDFNTHKGKKELDGFIKKNNLKLIQSNATFPAKKPKKTLDFILASPGIKLEKTGVLNVQYSDHLPIWIKIKI